MGDIFFITVGHTGGVVFFIMVGHTGARALVPTLPIACFYGGKMISTIPKIHWNRRGGLAVWRMSPRKTDYHPQFF